ncbi:histidine phosphatase family protein [Paenibacillus sp. HW567]|uniref:histidine phosphatase family protein n=1 Tax=Paenibacillus sp. HW567 TaxID=1034769 RepID=UPI00035DB6BF|nr:histidine phosphatase family protein [Paenibacillus sp. HW567]
MTIGLVRHFRVAAPPKRAWMSGAQFNEWVSQYEAAEIWQSAECKSSGHVWARCLCSDQSRAISTARLIYAGELLFTAKLREVRIAAVPLGGCRLPTACWLILGRIFWSFEHHSQPENRHSVIGRVKDAVDALECEQKLGNVLAVSHGAFMKLLDRELRRRGYKGKRMINPRNGQLYVYEKKT